MTGQHIGYGVIGTGMMGVEHISNILALDDTSVVAIADTDEGSRTAGLAAAGPHCRVYDDYTDLLADDAVDAVVVVTPNFTHVDVMRDVLASGKHVLCEKPLCTTTADCRTLIELGDGYDGVIWVGLEYRYMPAVEALIDEVRRGYVGDVKMVAIREHRFPFLVKVDDWNRFSRNTGGTLVEKTCHYFDLMNLIIGDRPVQVFASGAQDVNHLDEVYNGERSDILDNAFVIVDYPGGQRAMLDLCMFAEATKDQEELSVVGDKGKLDARIPTSELHLGTRSGEGIPDIGQVETRPIVNAEIRHEGLHHGASYLEHVDFAAAIRTYRLARSTALAAAQAPTNAPSTTTASAPTNAPSSTTAAAPTNAPSSTTAAAPTPAPAPTNAPSATAAAPTPTNAPSATATAAAVAAAHDAVDSLGTLVSLEDGLWSVAMGEAAHRSIAENRPVRLDEILGV